MVLSLPLEKNSVATQLNVFALSLLNNIFIYGNLIFVKNQHGKILNAFNFAMEKIMYLCVPISAIILKLV